MDGNSNMLEKKFIDTETEDIISKLAQDETGKRQYYRPVYSLHKWWARRPGALFRLLILLANQPDQKLFNLNGNGSLSSSSEYFQHHDLQHVIILDPFMGGGTTLVEANRLGAKVIGCDLNPVSYWIVRESLKPIDLKKLEYYYKKLEKIAGEKIKALYKTRCQQCYTECDSLYTFWVRYVTCPHCKEPAYLFKRSLLNEGLSRNKAPSRTNPATAFCPKCFTLNVWHGSGESSCSVCGHHFDPQQGTYDQGYYSCFHCNRNHISLLKSLENGQKLHERLVAIEYLCSCNHVRTYKSPDAEDLARITCIEGTVKTLWEKLIHPTQKILEGTSSVRWLNHNYRYYYEVFNARQLLAFHFLIEGVKTIPEEEYRNAFFTIFSNSLEYNNMMTPYNYPHRKLHHLFNYHAMPLTTTPVENAVWGIGSEGAGTFVNCYHRYMKAKKYCQAPFDKFKDSKGKVYTILSKHEKIEAQFVSSFQEAIETPRSAFLLCGDSSKLSSIPNKSVDFVITDPPYFDSIHYSELSNFFYVWLRSLVNHEYFSKEQVPTDAEAIVNQGMDKGEKEYQALLSGVFKESERVLKDHGKLLFTFHHTKWRAWWTVLQALTESDFRVVESFPVMSEYKVNPHIRNKQSLDMDLVLICQKKSLPYVFSNLEPSAVLQGTIHELGSDVADHSDNKLFLHFMGELLKTASSAQEKHIVDYHWFSEALTHFDDFLKTIIRVEKHGDQTVSEPVQMRLLEDNTNPYSVTGQ
jgi:putative DNA methylase